MDNRKAFLYQDPPEGYVAGIGRGAAGFVTSADKGLRIEPGVDFNQDNDDKGDENLEAENNDEDREDEATGLLASNIEKVSKDDEEADKVFDGIEKRMKMRNKKANKVTENSLAVDNQTKENFTDLKRSLADISNEEWMMLPEASDFTRKNKRTRLFEKLHQRFYAAPDTMIAGAGSFDSNKTGVLQEPTDFGSISQAREKLLSSHLDNLAPRADTTDANDLLDSMADTSTKIADFEKGREILASLRRAEPFKANSWIASARLELENHKYAAAKRLITEGCKKVPRNPDIWLESLAIHNKSSDGSKVCKGIVSEGLKYNLTSEDLWLKAFELENTSDFGTRRATLMRGLEYLTSSASLWRRLIDMEQEPQVAKKLLSKAIEFCPQEWDLWLSLINISDYGEAKVLLNRARKLMPTNHLVWVTATKLEEREDPKVTALQIATILAKGFKQLLNSSSSSLSNSLNIRDWLAEAATAQREGFTKTSIAIIRNTFDLGEPSEFSEKIASWTREANQLIKDSNIETAKHIYDYIIEKYPHHIKVWASLLNLLKSNTNFDLNVLHHYYDRAIELNPEREIFPLMYAKDLWLLDGDVGKARELLKETSNKMLESEAVWFARIKLEIRNNNYEEAKKLSTDSVKTLPRSSARVWYKHIHLMRFLNRVNPIDHYADSILSICGEAIEIFPDEDKLYLQKGQILRDDLKEIQAAKEVFSLGARQFGKSVPLWISLSQVEEQNLKSPVKARSTLDKAIFLNPENDVLWYEKVNVEIRHNNIAIAKQTTNKALKLYPHSPILWIQHLKLLEKNSQRKNAFVDALKNTQNSPLIMLNIGIFLFLEGKFAKAKSWFNRSLKEDPCNGDIWGWLYVFIKRHESDIELHNLREEFENMKDDINRGDTYVKVTKLVENLNATSEDILNLLSEELIYK